MGVVQNSIDIQKIIEAGGDPEIAAKVQELEAEIGDENSGIIKDIDDLQEANALIMTSVSAIKTTADSAKARADQAVLWSERKGYVGKNLLPNKASSTEINGVTYTVNADGSIKANGTASANSTLFLISKANTPNFLSDLNGKNIIISGGHNDSKRVQMWSTNGGVVYSGNTETEVSITENIAGSADFNIVINIIKDAVCDNEIFYPMFRIASVADETYEPYLPNNNELLQTATLKSVTAAAADFAAFKTAIAAL